MGNNRVVLIGNEPNDRSVALRDVLLRVFILFRKYLHITEAG